MEDIRKNKYLPLKASMYPIEQYHTKALLPAKGALKTQNCLFVCIAWHLHKIDLLFACFWTYFQILPKNPSKIFRHARKWIDAEPTFYDCQGKFASFSHQKALTIGCPKTINEKVKSFYVNYRVNSEFVNDLERTRLFVKKWTT